MDGEIAVHEALRREIRQKYRDIAVDADRSFDFYTGRPLTARWLCGGRAWRACARMVGYAR